ncbi:uncharacterized protein LOC121789448 [Salvia splendens]|uniref:uncharacterized protein LOC121789448 n=1 Tax=Salvia splendens TaxID=180675 RepID=UPI001C25E672|nr:uncharacterized protein LOC121789448 [Salvia splendens]
MSDLGEEFIIEGYKVAWLIWIQLVVMFLLIILLFFGFSAFTFEPSTSSTASPASAAAAPPPHLNNPSSSRRRDKAEVQRTTRDRASIAEFTREVQNGEESSSKDSSFLRIFRNPNHPCNYFDVAKRAVLKCLGLDSSSEPSRRSDQHDKQE